jgi:hypothetical protein
MARVNPAAVSVREQGRQDLSTNLRFLPLMSVMDALAISATAAPTDNDPAAATCVRPPRMNR